MTRPPPSSPFFPSPPLSRSPRIAPPPPPPPIAGASARGARAHPPRRASSCERALQDSRHHPATVEVLLGEAAREATVSLIIGLDRRQRAHRIVHRSAPEQARGVGQPAGPGVLHHRPFPAGQVAD